jgi:hypothetical protein
MPAKEEREKVRVRVAGIFSPSSNPPAQTVSIVASGWIVILVRSPI